MHEPQCMQPQDAESASTPPVLPRPNAPRPTPRDAPAEPLPGRLERCTPPLAAAASTHRWRPRSCAPPRRAGGSSPGTTLSPSPGRTPPSGSAGRPGVRGEPGDRGRRRGGLAPGWARCWRRQPREPAAARQPAPPAHGPSCAHGPGDCAAASSPAPALASARGGRRHGRASFAAGPGRAPAPAPAPAAAARAPTLLCAASTTTAALACCATRLMVSPMADAGALLVSRYMCSSWGILAESSGSMNLRGWVGWGAGGGVGPCRPRRCRRQQQLLLPLRARRPEGLRRAHLLRTSALAWTMVSCSCCADTLVGTL
jgi:hypothetical protein